MDPSIMKLLEEDEDESMHSRADVAAFTAALNRDIEGGASSSQPSHSDTSVATDSQENNQTSSQMYSQWQPSKQDENNVNLCQQQPILFNQEQREGVSSESETKDHGSSVVEMQQEVNNASQASRLPSQYTAMQADSKIEESPGEYSQSSAAMQILGADHSQIPESAKMHNNLSSGTQYTNMQNAQIPETDRIQSGSQFSNTFSSNQPVPMSEQGGSSAHRGKQIPFGSLLPIILPELDKDRAMQLQTLYTKLRKNEIPKDGFVRLMRNIVGDQMLRLAVVKMQAKSQSPSQQQHLRPPTVTTAQFSDPNSFGQLQQKSQSTHSATVTGPPRTTASVMQPQIDSGHQIVDSNSLKSREMEHPTDSHRMKANQMSSRSPIPIQGLTKQQQEHLHFSHSTFPTFSATGYHPYAGTNVGSSSTMVKPQPHDPQMRQHQGFGSTYGDGTSQAVNVMNGPKVERQTNDPKSGQGPTMPNISTPIMQHSWQTMSSREQKLGALPSIGYVKQEPSEQVLEKQSKALIFASQGPNFSGAVQIEQGKVVPGTSNDDLSQRQNAGLAFSSSTRTSNMFTSSSVSTQMDVDFQVGPQSISASPMNGIGSNSKTSAKKPLSGQKKPLDAHASSPPLPSKKQKVSGAFSDQSIEHLNDVTAVSGVNLREEEEQLFSGPKDDSRVSEASRRAVQEEEDRLLLQKVPLQKKLAEIMTKCGLKNLSNDVERCLSLCVEERLRALISSLIRVSKQRVDSEKSRRSTVVTSDVREQILTINQKAREEWEKKQAEAEKLRKQNEPDAGPVIDIDREKDDGRSKSLKVNKEEDDKMRTTAANVAARAAVGGDDMLSKWQLMAQARQKREGGPEAASGSQSNKDYSLKQLTTSSGNIRDNRGAGKKDQSAATGTSEAIRQNDRSQVSLPPPRVAPCISIKDVIAVLEREPQMAKSTMIYRLYDRVQSDAAPE